MNHAPPPRVTAEPARVAVPSRMFVHAYDFACVCVRVCACVCVFCGEYSYGTSVSRAIAPEDV